MSCDDILGVVEELGRLHDVGEHLPHPSALPGVPEEVGDVGEAGHGQGEERHPHVVRVPRPAAVCVVHPTTQRPSSIQLPLQIPGAVNVTKP